MSFILALSPSERTHMFFMTMNDRNEGLARQYDELRAERIQSGDEAIF